jgi:ankyrin repeat protein
VQALARLVADTRVPIDAPDAAGRTALLHAVLAQQPGAVRLLLAAGADPDLADHAGLSARAAATRAGASPEIATLLAGGAR